MGQSPLSTLENRLSAANRTADQASVPQLAVFITDLGWFALLGFGDAAFGLTIGHASQEEVRSAVRDRFAAEGLEAVAECDWNPRLRTRLERYARGELVDFTDCPVRLPELTPFQRKIVAATQNIPYGRTTTYSRLAAAAGRPRAARAVGNVMASNCMPIVIPCHRVVPASGRFGGFSAPQGVALKQRMLEMEAETARDNATVPGK